MIKYKIEFDTDKEHFEDAARGLVWTVLFQRIIGQIYPHCGKFISVKYPFIEISELRNLVDAEINTVEKVIESQDPSFSVRSDSSTDSFGIIDVNKGDNMRDSQVFVIEISFYESKKQTRDVIKDMMHNRHIENYWIFLKNFATENHETEKDLQELCWERWHLQFRVYYSREMNEKGLEQQFKDKIVEILEFAKSSELPPIHDVSYAPFPYSISLLDVAKKKNQRSDWMSYIRKVI